jgi:hypothetical protein
MLEDMMVTVNTPHFESGFKADYMAGSLVPP